MPNIQTGEITYTSGSGTDPTDIVLGASVDLAKSIVLFTAKDGQTSTDLRERRHKWNCEIVNSGADLSFSRHEATSAAPMTIRWYVIEFDAPTAVQQGTVDLDANPDAIDLSADPPDDRYSIVYTSHKGAHSGFGDGYTAVTERPEFTDITANAVDTLTIHLGFTPDAAGEYILHWQVVEFDPDQIEQIEYHKSEPSTGPIDFTFGVAVASVTKTLIVGHWRAAQGSNHLSHLMGLWKLIDTTKATADWRYEGSFDNVNITAFMVEFVNWTTASGTATITATNASVDVDGLSLDIDLAFPAETGQQGIAGTRGTTSDGNLGIPARRFPHHFLTNSGDKLTLTRAATLLGVECTYNVLELTTVILITLAGTVISEGEPKESEIVSGGKTITLTVSGDTWR